MSRGVFDSDFVQVIPDREAAHLFSDSYTAGRILGRDFGIEIHFFILDGAFLCKAAAHFSPENDGDLALEIGDVIEVEAKFRNFPGWWSGRNVKSGFSGQFPSSFVSTDYVETSPVESGLIYSS